MNYPEECSVTLGVANDKCPRFTQIGVIHKGAFKKSIIAKNYRTLRYHFVAKKTLYYNKIIKTTAHNLIMWILLFEFH